MAPIHHSENPYNLDHSRAITLDSLNQLKGSELAQAGKDKPDIAKHILDTPSLWKELLPEDYVTLSSQPREENVPTAIKVLTHCRAHGISLSSEQLSAIGKAHFGNSVDPDDIKDTESLRAALIAMFAVLEYGVNAHITKLDNVGEIHTDNRIYGTREHGVIARGVAKEIAIKEKSREVLTRNALKQLSELV